MLKDFFREFEKYGKEGGEYFTNTTDDKKYRIVGSMPQDKKSVQTVSLLGGGSAVKEYFCSYCPVTRAHGKGQSAPYTCEDCVKSPPPHGRECCHREFVCGKKAEELRALPADDPRQRYSIQRSTTVERTNAQRRAFLKDVLLIDADLVNKLPDAKLASTETNFFEEFDVTDLTVYSTSMRCVMKMLKIRGIENQQDINRTEKFAREIPIFDNLLKTGKLNNKQQEKDRKLRILLKYALFMGDLLFFCKQQESDTHDAIVKTIEMLVPCIMHGEMRIGETILTKLFRCALQEGTKEQGQARLSRCEKLMNARLGGVLVDNGEGVFIQIPYLDGIENHYDVAGINGDPRPAESQYHIQRDKDNDVKPTIKISCVRQRKFMSIIDQLIDIIFDEEPTAMQAVRRKQKAYFHSLFTMFKSCAEQLRFRNKFSEERIAQLQLSLDNFCHLFIKMFGATAVTNYIHDWHSGHMRYFLRRYGNLYIHANIGLESKMGQIKKLILRRSPNGGHEGAGNNRNCSYMTMKRFMLRTTIQMAAQLGEEPEDFLYEIRKPALVAHNSKRRDNYSKNKSKIKRKKKLDPVDDLATPADFFFVKIENNFYVRQKQMSKKRRISELDKAQSNKEDLVNLDVSRHEDSELSI